MRKEDILDKLSELPFPKDEYWVITGSAMVLYGLREKTHDIDLGAKSTLIDRLACEGYEVSEGINGKRLVKYSEDIEILEEFLFDRVVDYENYPVISLEGLLEMKRSLGREKDFRDIKLIEEYMK